MLDVTMPGILEEEEKKKVKAVTLISFIYPSVFQNKYKNKYVIVEADFCVLSLT